jgi:zinc transporter ZupT
MNSLLLILIGIEVAGIVIGMNVMRSQHVSARFKAISAGIMVGVALFWIFPDLMQKTGALHAALITSVGLAALCGIDRFVYPVCPCCAHHHNEQHFGGGAHALSPGANGLLIPLLIAICVHNLFDGWTAAAASHAGATTGLGLGIGLIAHKIPEAVVFGLMLRAASGGRTRLAVFSVGATSLAILAGGMMHRNAWALSEATLLATSLALACSSFLFTGGHIFMQHQRRAGTRSALGPLLVGLFCSAVVEQAVTLFAQ